MSDIQSLTEFHNEYSDFICAAVQAMMDAVDVSSDEPVMADHLRPTVQINALDYVGRNNDFETAYLFFLAIKAKVQLVDQTFVQSTSSEIAFRLIPANCTKPHYVCHILLNEKEVSLHMQNEFSFDCICHKFIHEKLDPIDFDERLVNVMHRMTYVVKPNTFSKFFLYSGHNPENDPIITRLNNYYNECRRTTLRVPIMAVYRFYKEITGEA